MLNYILPNFRYELLKVKYNRNKSYIKYKSDIMLLERILATICGIESMNEMTKKLNNTNVIHNLNQLTNSNYDDIAHYTTLNNYLKVVATEDLDRLRYNMIKELITKKYFYDYRILDKYWKVAIDGTGVYTFDNRHCEHCLTRTYNKGTEEEKQHVFCNDYVAMKNHYILIQIAYYN